LNFASYEFWKLLVLCFLGSRLVLAAFRTFLPTAESAVAKVCLFSTALILLGSESTTTLLCFLWVVLLGWAALLLHGTSWQDRLKSLLFVLLIAAQLVPLFYYKYWNFLLNEVLGFDLRIPSILIPMGLSFYTFQTIGFWVDQRRNPKPIPRFIDYLNFSSFFPQIVAGPIEKRENLLPQVETIPFRIVPANIDAALRWIVLGLAYKMVIADNLGVIPDKFQIDPSNPFHIWLDIFTFSIRIYFDFAGYSFIAIGLGLIFGIHLTLNFRCPYWSANVREYWRTWHITLGAWLRDYIYLPLGGHKSGNWILNTLIVFLVSGIWHGAGWGFIIWGLLHGIGITLCSREKNKKLPWPIRWFVTFTFITATRLFFMETNNSILFEKTLSFINPLSYNLSNLKSFPSAIGSPLEALSLLLILSLSFIALLAEGLGILNKKEPYHYCKLPAVVILMVFLIVFLAPMEESKFIYFNF